MFTKIFFSVLVLAVLFGFVLPYLISSRSNEMPLLGGAIIITLAYLLGKYITKIFNKEKR